MKDLYEAGDLAIIHGVGYENPSRSHFRSMDIWHTCEPLALAEEGWIGRSEREIDPGGENPVGIVSVGYGLPRALVAPGVPVASVTDLETFGLYTDAQHLERRDAILELFQEMYSPAIGSGVTGEVMSYLGQTGRDALKSADILKDAAPHYRSNVEYGSDNLGQSLRTIATVHAADLGVRFFYATHGGFDTHASQTSMHSNLWTQVSRGVADFWDDSGRSGGIGQRRDAALLRVRPPGEGERSRDRPWVGRRRVCRRAKRQGRDVFGVPEQEPRGACRRRPGPDPRFSSVYSELLEDWMGLDAGPIVNGSFEKSGFIANS